MTKELHKIMQEWPLKSTLDPKIYGPPESAITTEIVEREIKGFMTVDEVCTSLLCLFFLFIILPVELCKSEYMNECRH